ncbi:MAG: hypothetical protein ACMUEM_07855 [Flavobacteriales bacterium AspAUS03]
MGIWFFSYKEWYYCFLAFPLMMVIFKFSIMVSVKFDNVSVQEVWARLLPFALVLPSSCGG